MGNKHGNNSARGPDAGQADSDRDKANKVVINYPNGDIYEGDLTNMTQAKNADKSVAQEEDGKDKRTVDVTRHGLREGYGRFLARDTGNHRNYEYVGDWLDNKRDGQGRCYFYNGDLYQGQWKNGKRNGHGTCFMQNGERYVGMYQDDMKHGQGTLWAAAGTKYVGGFKNDQKDGEGQMFSPGGSIRLQEWRMGQLTNTEKISKPTAENAQDPTSLVATPPRDGRMSSLIESLDNSG